MVVDDTRRDGYPMNHSNGEIKMNFMPGSSVRIRESHGHLTTFARDIVAASLDETLPSEVTLLELAAGTPLLWEERWGRVGKSTDLY